MTQSFLPRLNPVIRLTNVGLKYDSGPDVLTDVTFHLRPGSFHFLHGESGAGKTSLLRLMFMSLHPSRGEIRMFNEDITAVKPQKRSQMRRRIGIVFQDFRLLDHLTVWENVALPLQVVGEEDSWVEPAAPPLQISLTDETPDETSDAFTVTA